jgi:hypothetical protein
MMQGCHKIGYKAYIYGCQKYVPIETAFVVLVS